MKRTLAVGAAAVAAALCALAFGGPAAAEKPLMSPAALEKVATHVIVGRVQTIYSRVTVEGMFRVSRFVAEIAVESVEKGEGLAKGTLVYARFWTQGWLGKPSEIPPGTSGHTGNPQEGERWRVYLASNAYDGFGDTRDGG